MAHADRGTETLDSPRQTGQVGNSVQPSVGDPATSADSVYSTDIRNRI